MDCSPTFIELREGRHISNFMYLGILLLSFEFKLSCSIPILFSQDVFVLCVSKNSIVDHAFQELDPS